MPASAAEPPRRLAWSFEPKLDGYRLAAVTDGSRVRLFTKSGTEYTTRLPCMVEAFEELASGAAVLDGELVAVDATGQATFRKLHAQMRTRWPDKSQLVFLRVRHIAS